MREIIFRGKRLDEGDWIEGYLLQLHRSERTFIVPKLFVHRGTLRMSGETPPNIIPIEVIPETVGQYTDLTDKHGKKIFEGDIVRNNKCGDDNDTYDYYLTIFSNGSFRAQYLDNLKYTPKIYDIYFKGYEVIGNIHDNPELLEDEE